MTYKSTKRLFVEFAVFCVAIVLPISAHAYLFSDFFSTNDAVLSKSVEYNQNTNAQLVPLLRAAINIDPNLAKGGGDIIVSNGALVPSGNIDGKDEIVNTKTNNGEISIYVVREGDTLSQIASMYDVNSKTILWANDIKNGVIQPGDDLIILPIAGVRHIVKKGDSLGSIAKKYGTETEDLDDTVDDIMVYNQLASANDISVGDTIVVPGGEIKTSKPVRRASSYNITTVASGGGSAGFIHPLPNMSSKTQGVHGYNAVDLAAPRGTSVLAAARGEVIVSRSSGWNGGYGLYVVIKHPNGTQTLYAHMSGTAVGVGSKVSAGQIIGYVGNTGRSTGDHLHFEVRGARNPF